MAMGGRGDGQGSVWITHSTCTFAKNAYQFVKSFPFCTFEIWGFELIFFYEHHRHSIYLRFHLEIICTHTHNQKKSRKRLIDIAFYFKYPNMNVGVNGEKNYLHTYFRRRTQMPHKTKPALFSAYSVFTVRCKYLVPGKLISLE